MITTEKGPAAIARYVELFDDVIGSALANGLSGDWNASRRRLDRIARRLETYVITNERLGTTGHGLRMQRAMVLEVVRETLSRGGLDRLTEELSRRRPFEHRHDPGVWNEMGGRFEQLTEHQRSRAHSAESAVIASLKHYASKPSIKRVDEGLRALSDLSDTVRVLEPFFDVAQLEAGTDELETVLSECVPARARDLLGLAIHDRCRSRVEGTPPPTLPTEPWSGPSRDLPDLDIDRPIWRSRKLGRGEPDRPEPWFVPAVQRTYVRWRREAATAQRHRERERQRELRRIEAERTAPERRSPIDQVAKQLAETGAPLEQQRRERADAGARELAHRRADEDGAATRRTGQTQEQERRAGEERNRQVAAVEVFAREGETRKREARERARRPVDFWSAAYASTEIHEEREFARWCKARGISTSEVPELRPYFHQR